MKAIVLTRYRSPDFFELKEVEKPKPKDNEVLVKVFDTIKGRNIWMNGKRINLFIVGCLPSSFVQTFKVNDAVAG